MLKKSILSKLPYILRTKQTRNINRNSLSSHYKGETLQNRRKLDNLCNRYLIIVIKDIPIKNICFYTLRRKFWDPPGPRDVEKLLYSYYLQRVQVLNLEDLAHRLNIINLISEELFSDEACFTEKYAVLSSRYQQQFSINIL